MVSLCFYLDWKPVPVGSVGIVHQMQMNIGNVDDVDGLLKPMSCSFQMLVVNRG